jgi:hypothetical protein
MWTLLEQNRELKERKSPEDRELKERKEFERSELVEKQKFFEEKESHPERE